MGPLDKPKKSFLLLQWTATILCFVGDVHKLARVASMYDDASDSFTFFCYAAVGHLMFHFDVRVGTSQVFKNENTPPELRKCSKVSWESESITKDKQVATPGIKGRAKNLLGVISNESPTRVGDTYDVMRAASHFI